MKFTGKHLYLFFNKTIVFLIWTPSTQGQTATTIYEVTIKKEDKGEKNTGQLVRKYPRITGAY